MFITDLNYLEVVSESESLKGGTLAPTYYEYDKIVIDFNSKNKFDLKVDPALTFGNNASAGAKGDAINNTKVPSWSFTKADTLAVTELFGGSFSASTSAAVINPAFPM